MNIAGIFALIVLALLLVFAISWQNKNKKKKKEKEINNILEKFKKRNSKKY